MRIVRIQTHHTTEDQTMTNPTFRTNRTFKDAGLMREYLAARYGSVLEFGSTPGTYFHAIRVCRILARMTSQTVEAVIDTIRNDYRIAND